jgi:hypothetical protein
LQATAAAGNTLQWFTVPTGGSASTTAPTPNTSTAGTTLYYVSQKNDATGCESSRITITVIVNDLPVAPVATTTVNLCQGASASALSATALSGHTLQWYTVASGGNVTTIAPTPSTTTLGTTIFYVSQVNASGCEGPRTAITVNVNALPTISGVQNMTVGGSTLQLTGSGTPDSTSPWTSSNTAVATISATGEVTAVAGGLTTITYTTASGCSVAQTLRVVDCGQPFGNALAFDGTNDFVEILDNNAIDVTTAFTIEAWVYPTTVNTSQVIIGKIVDNNLGNAADIAYALRFSAAGFRAEIGNGIAGQSIVSANYTLNKWQHVAMVFNGANNGSLSLFIDGVLQGTTTTNYSSIQNIATSLKLGAYNTHFGQYFRGNLDEFRIWNVAKTQAQIAASMYTEMVGNEAGLVTNLGFNQGLAAGSNTNINTALNSANSNLNGTLLNFARSGTSSNFVESTISNFSISGVTTLCGNSSAQYTHPITGGTWSVPNGAAASVSASGLLTSTTNETVTLSYTYSLNGCAKTDIIVITIKQWCCVLYIRCS